MAVLARRETSAATLSATTTIATSMAEIATWASIRGSTATLLPTAGRVLTCSKTESVTKLATMWSACLTGGIAKMVLLSNAGLNTMDTAANTSGMDFARRDCEDGAAIQCRAEYD